MERDLGAILEAFESLGRVDVSGVEPMVHPVSDLGGLREDVVLPSLKRREALAQAPAPRNHAFSVPKVL